MRELMTVIWLVMLAAWGCSGTGDAASSSDAAAAADTIAPRIPDTLRVATLYSPSSYFIYREEPMGYDYSLIQAFAADAGVAVDLQVATSLTQLVALLDSGKVDVLAYEIPVTADYREHVRQAGPVTLTHQVLVQPRTDSLVRSITELTGKDIYVERGTKYHQRLLNLNDELGGGIRIHAMDRDTLTTEDLLDMVSDGRIPMTIVDSDIAAVNKTYYPNLDITLEVSFAQKAAWGVRPDMAWLADSIDTWLGREAPARANKELLRRYFELSKSLPPSAATYDFSHGRISPYDEYFRASAPSDLYDWRLMAAQGFVESRFDNTVVSWAGAKGIMQIMPSTARANGLDANTILVPEQNIRAAGKILASLDKSLAAKVADAQERRLFVLAAYNSGLAHILDAIALAAKYGKDPQRWNGNVEEALLMKSRPEYYNDPVCRFGYFRGTQTVEYVRHVMDFYRRACQKIKK